MGEGDGGLVGEDGGVGEWLLPFSLCLSQGHSSIVSPSDAIQRAENASPRTTPPELGENCVQQLYHRAATVANEQQDYHSDPCCY